MNSDPTGAALRQDDYFVKLQRRAEAWCGRLEELRARAAVARGVAREEIQAELARAERLHGQAMGRLEMLRLDPERAELRFECEAAWGRLNGSMAELTSLLHRPAA